MCEFKSTIHLAIYFFHATNITQLLLIKEIENTRHSVGMIDFLDYILYFMRQRPGEFSTEKYFSMPSASTNKKEK